MENQAGASASESSWLHWRVKGPLKTAQNWEPEGCRTHNMQQQCVCDNVHAITERVAARSCVMHVAAACRCDPCGTDDPDDATAPQKLQSFNSLSPCFSTKGRHHKCHLLCCYHKPAHNAKNRYECDSRGLGMAALLQSRWVPWLTENAAEYVDNLTRP